MAKRVFPLALLVAFAAARPHEAPASVQFVFTADAHYGITRASFRGRTIVDAHVVNAAMIAQMRRLPDARFPRDGGVRAGEVVGPIDFIAEGGDVANRAEHLETGDIQPAARSWAQFEHDYEALPFHTRSGRRSPLYVIPGNHDASNAVGFYRDPGIDTVPMIAMFNRALPSQPPRDAHTFDYARDTVVFARDLEGVHFVFTPVWPDSKIRSWLDRDMAALTSSTPIVLFTHDQPDAEAKHFRNPNPPYDINATDRFENLLADRFADGPSVDEPALIEHRALEAFVRQHPNLVAYFHGNANWNEFYDWRGPDRSVALHTFRVDSPMKGAVSAWDETALSFQVAVIDVSGRRMTVRECLWNIGASERSPLVWSDSATVAFADR